MIKDCKRKIFNIPSDDTILWQYMSLEKFLLLIMQKKLYFCRIDLFDDKNEGVLPTIDKGVFGSVGFTEADWEKIREGTFINCWIESPYELALMWDSYGKGGVAIQTTVGRIRKSMEHDTSRYVKIGRVKYLASENNSTQVAGNPLNYMKASMAKRKYYAQEQEVRLLYHNEDTDKGKSGVLIDAKLDVLVEKVVLNPKAKPTFEEIVKEALNCKGLDLPVRHSEILINTKLKSNENKN